MDERKKKILQAVIDEYINTAEPVSSSALVEKYELKYSSATVRNELAELEKNGYLDKTHTSSGRVPSEKGYRFYVDELVKEDDISLEEMKYIQSKLSTKVNEIEDLAKIATTTLSEITHYTTVAIGPKPEKQLIEEIKFILLGNRMLMIVIVTDSGLVKETIIKYDKDVLQSQIETLNNLFNTKLKGKPLSKIDKPMEEYILDEINYSIDVIKPIIDQINRIVEEADKIYLEGTNRSFDLPEFKSLELAKNFVNVLDEKEVMLDILDSGVAKDINVYIGDENDKKELKDFSVVTFKHSIGDRELGTIGIIGPKRMNYSKVISVMKYISKRINQDKQNEKKDNKEED
ncbi:MAG: heat-inducible transcription repressor HrcA [Clostridiaceae bacterium]|nr:heat-inducible transcription repressor HrcA [Clostridiaceae bacterium]